MTDTTIAIAGVAYRLRHPREFGRRDRRLNVKQWRRLQRLCAEVGADGTLTGDEGRELSALLVAVAQRALAAPAEVIGALTDVQLLLVARTYGKWLEGEGQHG